MFRVTSRAFHLPKRGSSDAEYEDAIGRGNRRGNRPRRFAVADGASESSFAGLWARLLVEAYACGAIGGATLIDDLRVVQARWREETAAKPLPWYAAEKLRAGAFAALVGLTLRPDGTWSALAVGDCCVLHVREDALIGSFPLGSAAAFDNSPLLISSNPERNAHLGEGVPCIEGTWQPGDGFLLLSDALAAYVLGRVVDDGWAVSRATAMPGGDRGFAAWIDGLRAERVLRNDDVSLLRVRVI